MDYKLEQLINGAAGSHAVLDGAMLFIANAAAPLFASIVVAWFLWGLWQRRAGDRLGAVLALIASGIALVINIVISGLWYRPRPFVSHPHVHLLVTHARDASFPSDHAAAGFAIAVVLCGWHRRWGALLLAFGLLMDYARVFVGEHYPGDVAAGTLIGIAVAIACQLLLRDPLARAMEIAERKVARVLPRVP